MEKEGNLFFFGCFCKRLPPLSRKNTNTPRLTRVRIDSVTLLVPDAFVGVV